MRRNWRGATRHVVSSAPTSTTDSLPPAGRRHMLRLRSVCAAWITLYCLVAMAIGGGAAQAEDASPTDIPIVGRLANLGAGTKVLVDEGAHHFLEFLGSQPNPG